MSAPVDVDARRLGNVMGALAGGSDEHARAYAKELTARERRAGADLLRRAADLLEHIDRPTADTPAP